MATPIPTLANPVPYKDIVIVQGADFRMDLAIIYRDEDGNAHLHDTEDWDVLFQVRKEPSADSPVLVEASTSNGRIVVGIQGVAPNQKNITLKVPASVTKLLEDWGRGGFDLSCKYPNFDIDLHLSGPACLKRAYAWRS